MKLEQQSLSTKNTFLADYWSGSEKVKEFFDYTLEEASFKTRAAYLKSKSYQFEQLADVITNYMMPFGISEKTQQHIDQLRNGAIAVVGGQQAGVLTGPLYSVHKAMSVIMLAQQQTEKLQTPVIPIFWIAGEDHDLEEINHTFTIVNGEVKKRGYGERSNLKTMASTTPLNQEAMTKFVRGVFADFGETIYTKALLESVLAHVKNSDTFTEFFTSLMNELFENHGLVMIDAAYTPFRQLQSAYFTKLIMHNEEIASKVVAKEQQLTQAGYGTPIEATIENANLFIVKEGERFLMSREGDAFVQASAQLTFTKEELLTIAQNEPQQLSNNVVTRPLMQEMALPVLAFVGGPGELAYWATLKDAFSLLDLQMPIFAPRMNISLVTRQVQTSLQQQQLTFEDVMNHRVAQDKQAFISRIQEVEAQQKIDNMYMALSSQMEELQEHLTKQGYQLDEMMAKNLAYHKKQLNYLESKIQQQLLEKHNVEIRRFNTIESELLPSGGFQERVFSPYHYLNIYGPSLIDDLLELPLVLDAQHKVVYI